MSQTILALFHRTDRTTTIEWFNTADGSSGHGQPVPVSKVTDLTAAAACRYPTYAFQAFEKGRLVARFGPLIDMGLRPAGSCNE